MSIMFQKFYDNSILSGTKIVCLIVCCKFLFYDNSILSGTKIILLTVQLSHVFYDNSILSGTKMERGNNDSRAEFYDNSILSGTKIASCLMVFLYSFTITQFFQVLKYQIDNFLDISAPFTITLHDYITSFSIKKAFSKEFKPLSTDVLIQSVSWSNFKSTLLFK